MTHTFLVAVNTPDGFDPSGEAADIEEALVAHGIDVTSVRMWQAPTVGMPTFSPIQPQQLPPTQ